MTDIHAIVLIERYISNNHRANIYRECLKLETHINVCSRVNCDMTLCYSDEFLHFKFLSSTIKLT